MSPNQTQNPIGASRRAVQKTTAVPTSRSTTRIAGTMSDFHFEAYNFRMFTKTILFPLIAAATLVLLSALPCETPDTGHGETTRRISAMTVTFSSPTMREIAFDRRDYDDSLFPSR